MLCTVCSAQDYKKMSSYVRQLTQQNSLTVNAKATLSGNVSRNNKEEAIVVFVRSHNEDAVSRYCLRHQDDIHICQVPISELATLSEDARVIRIEAKPSSNTATLDLSASKVNAEPAWQGTSLPQAFQGRETLVGVIDCGIDYLHPTFRSTQDDRLKIVRAWDMIDISEGQQYQEKSHFPIGKFCNSEESIMRKGSTIDCDIVFHGTHTTSTAAGSGADTPYRGMAPEADIYSVCIYLSNNSEKIPDDYKKYYTDALEMLAYQNIFDYADSIGKPCVISCSFGGVQDMTDADKLKDAYFQKITGPGHIIVASAGNDGSYAGYMPKSTTTKTVGGRIICSKQQFIVNVSTQGKLKMHVTDYSKGIETRHTYDLDFLPGNTAEKSPSGLPWYDFMSSDKIPELDDLAISIYSGNNEFDPTHIGYDIFFFREDKKFNSHAYTVEFEGDGVEAEIFAQSGSLLPATQYSPTLTGAMDNSGNLGSPGALPTVICVGSMTHTNTWKDYKGMSHTWSGGKIGEVSSFSSRGPSLHGLTKPDVMAPGNLVKAGMSRAIYEKDPSKEEANIVAFSEYNGQRFPWARESGTSMSTPVAAGVIALWLEADPTLTKDDIMDVIANTSRQPVTSLSYPNNTYGYGEIDAYKGLLYILNHTGIPGVSTNHVQGIIAYPTPDGNIRIVRTSTDGNTQQNASSVQIRLFTTGGTLLRTAVLPAHDTELTIPASDLHGIIAVQCGNLGSTLVRMP